MSNAPTKPVQVIGDDSIELTQSLQKLTITADTSNDALEDLSGTALLICRDSASRKWAPRWLGQAGLQVSVAPDPANALALARETRPDVIFVESGLKASSGEPVYKALLDAADLASSVIVMCAGNRDIQPALDAGAFDVARKPYEWQSISNRAHVVLQMKARQAQLDESMESLGEALTLANAARERLRSFETFEPVTGLPNRSKFMDLLRRGMRAAERDGTTLAVFVIGFTRFRLVIEAMGQGQADRIMTEIGRTLDECLRNTEIESGASGQGLRTAAIASLDQFRFGLMMTRAAGQDSVAPLQNDLLEAFARPIQISGQTVHLSACLGVALYPQDADDVDSLLQRADNAMRDAQSRGGGFKYYCAETDAAAARKLRLEHMLHEALDRSELSMVYQPIVRVDDDALIAAEALLRWRQPDGSFISPEEFVRVAEESGLMLRTGDFALNQACRQFAAWRAAGIALPRICVNVARVQLMSSGFAASVRRTLEKHDIPAELLELEISERGVLSGDFDVIRQLHELKDLGVKLSLDDFGTGDSAIAYLKELPVDVLKIDRSYVSGLINDGKDAAIASAMVALGQRLGLTVVAEGVETAEQLEILRSLGCDAYQGYLMARGLDPDSFAASVDR